MNENESTRSTKHKFIQVDSEKCIGCSLCEIICSIEKNTKKAANPSISRIRVLRLYPATDVAIACRMCTKAPCVSVCPQNALSQSEKTGVISTNESKCNGCGWCIQACKFGCITIDSRKKIAVMCDLCEGRKGIGVFPGRKIMNQACVEWCPEEALDLVTTDKCSQKSAERAIADLLQA